MSVRIRAWKHGAAGAAVLLTVAAITWSERAPEPGQPATRVPDYLASRPIPPGVSTRDDCGLVPSIVEPDCRPRHPLGLPPGGGAAALALDPAVAAAVLCSGVPDSVVRQVLSGPFVAFTNGRGECHLDRSGLAEPTHSIALTASLSAEPLGAEPLGAAAESRAFVAGGLPARYLQPSTSTRYYRIGLATGTLLVSCRYTRFRDGRVLPAPRAFWTGTDRYVRALAAYLTR